MSDVEYRIADLGDRRVLTLGGRDYSTQYSARVVRLLVERKGARAPLYFPFRAERAPLFLDPLFQFLRARSLHGLSVLEVGCSFGHMTEYLVEQPEVTAVTTFDTDPAFVEIMRAKVEEQGLTKVREVRQLDNDATRRLPWLDGHFDLVLAVGVVEHLPERNRRAQVDEYYRVLTPGGHIAILDSPNRLFPLETHSVGLPLVQWLPARAAYRYARLCRPGRFRGVSFEEFTADGTGWQNATLADCLPSAGRGEIEDLTEAAGYGWRFFRSAARSRTRQSLLPVFALAVAGLRAGGLPPSLCLPYLNLLFRRREPDRIPGT